MIGMVDRADVYMPDANGTTTVLFAGGVRGRLIDLSNSLEGAGNSRDELADVLKFVWDAKVYIPTNAQIRIGGTRYNMTAEQQEIIRTASGHAVLRRCRVVLAMDGAS